MAATKGNRFWELRSKHGRDKIFTTPDLLWEAACSYFEWCEDNPLLESQIVKGNRTESTEIPLKGKNGKVQKTKSRTVKPYDIATLPKMRPFTMQGLCIYLGVNTKYFNDFSQNLKGKEDEESKDFSEIVTRIKEVVYTQKFTGAASGFFNANIIARDLGLSEKKEVKADVESNLIDYSKLSDSALEEIAKLKNGSDKSE